MCVLFLLVSQFGERKERVRFKLKSILGYSLLLFKTLMEVKGDKT